MDAILPILIDPAELDRRLDPEVIRKRLAALDREREALLVLLRAARRAGRGIFTPSVATEGDRQ